ncbi:hypothetical protein [Methylobacterium planeticum]|uniref:Uncharacterized protein n=1 Tax=Methylobacterium planeticum TaxID=2615211 RepID=A0A6N6MK47_9HYPH|nr:hypothetical protein [Methylobacterium planeticum]KAB1070420.1 hypothetical protein F6X51_22865 [Methylobacterium planeticum]
MRAANVTAMAAFRSAATLFLRTFPRFVLHRTHARERPQPWGSRERSPADPPGFGGSRAGVR